MRQLTERSAKWMEGVRAKFEEATGKPVEHWVKRVRAKGFGEDPKLARKWLKESEGLTIVQVSFVLDALFPQADDDEGALLDAQFAGAKAPLRPIYDRLAEVARGLGGDVMIAPRKSQVTFARQVTFAVVRAATKTRVDLALRLAGEKGTARLVANAKAAGSDPTHVVALAKVGEVDREVVAWMKEAYRRAAR
jgi:hypothetical protein